MNLQLVESLAQIIRSLTPEERDALGAKLQTQQSADLHLNQPSVPDDEPVLRGSKAADLLKFAGTWQGNDLEECLQLVYETRSKAEF